MTSIVPTATVAEIVAEHEATVRVFQKHGVDFWCFGDATVLEACWMRGVDPEAIFPQLQEAIAAAAGHGRSEDPRQLADEALVERIVERHHAYTRRALPYIVPLLARAASFHGRRNGKLNALCDAGHELADLLDAHLEEEERELFPAVVATTRRRRITLRELDHMHREHREVASLLDRIRSLADGYAAPAWAGRSYRTLLEELEALEDDVRRHMHLENHVLMPRLA